MNRMRIQSLLYLAVVLALGLSATGRAFSQDHPASYPSMAPIDQYLMTDREAEIALARSAAPEGISGDATILVLGRKGYETAVEGKNGWVCVVERAWMSPFELPTFWNPRVRGPVCFNPPAARSILPMTYKRTEMALAGKSKEQILEASKAAFEKKEMPGLEPGAMSYMMSKGQYLTDDGGHNFVPHLMFYTPHTDPPVWGADLPKSPVSTNPQFAGAEPIDVLVVPVRRWSDGTSAMVK
jgi:hypothetical protein